MVNMTTREPHDNVINLHGEHDSGLSVCLFRHLVTFGGNDAEGAIVARSSGDGETVAAVAALATAVEDGRDAAAHDAAARLLVHLIRNLPKHAISTFSSWV